MFDFPYEFGTCWQSKTPGSETMMSFKVLRAGCEAAGWDIQVEDGNGNIWTTQGETLNEAMWRAMGLVLGLPPEIANPVSCR